MMYVTIIDPHSPHYGQLAIVKGEQLGLDGAVDTVLCQVGRVEVEFKRSDVSRPQRRGQATSQMDLL